MALVYVANDNLLILDQLKNEADDSFINDATVTVTVVDSGGNNVAGQSWPTTMNYVAASNGKYRATLSDEASFTAGQSYTAQITADGGVGLLAYFETPLAAVTRTDK